MELLIGGFFYAVYCDDAQTVSHYGRGDDCQMA